MKRSFICTKLLASLIALCALTSCSPAQFSLSGDANKIYGTDNDGGDSGPPSTVCDPFDNSNIISATSGLQGTIHYLESTETTYTSSTDMIRNGRKVNADLFLNRLLVPTRVFETGFANNEGVGLKTADGTLLIEWFALNLNSKLKLGPNDEEGDYQLAIISDDGSTLNVQNSTGVFEALVDNEGKHPTRMGCASKVVNMTNTTKLPMNLTYFQGPRFHIALNLMWRKINRAPGGGNELAEEQCGKEGNDYFFNVGTATSPATPKTPYTNLLDVGWKPLTAENFELQSGSNRCAAPPVAP